MSMCEEQDVTCWTLKTNKVEIIVNATGGEICLIMGDDMMHSVVACALSEQACEQLELILTQAREMAHRQTQIKTVERLRKLSAAYIRALQAKAEHSKTQAPQQGKATA